MEINKMLDIKTLESWLWDCACKIRGEIDASASHNLLKLRFRLKTLKFESYDNLRY